MKDDVRYTKIDCFKMALEINPKYSLAWKNIGDNIDNHESILIPGLTNRFDKLACYAKVNEFQNDINSNFDNL